MKKIINFCRLYPGEAIFILCAVISLSAVLCFALLFRDALAVINIVLAVILHTVFGYFIPAGKASLSRIFHLYPKLWFVYYTIFSVIIILCALIMKKIELFIPLCVVLAFARTFIDPRDD